MPFYKDNAQNRKLNRVGKPYGKDAEKPAPKKPAPKKSAPKKPAPKKAVDISELGFYEIQTSHPDYLSGEQEYAEIMNMPVYKAFLEGGWYQGDAKGGAGLSARMTLKQAKAIRKKFKLGKSMRLAIANNKTGEITYSDF